MTTEQLPAPKSAITPVVASTVQIELAAVVTKVRVPKLELVVTVGVSTAPGRNIATLLLGYVRTKIGVALVTVRSSDI